MIAITSPGDFKKQHKAILLQAAVKHRKQQDYSFFFFFCHQKADCKYCYNGMEVANGGDNLQST